jgi:hypothetical protein
MFFYRGSLNCESKVWMAGQAVKTAKNWETKPTGSIKELNIRTNNSQEKLSEAKKIALRLKNPDQFQAHHHIEQHHFYIFEVK